MVLASSLAVVLAFSGVAMAADGASPGDLLYGVDRALESVGIGAGGIDERLAEFDSRHDISAAVARREGYFPPGVTPRIVNLPGHLPPAWNPGS